MDGDVVYHTALFPFQQVFLAVVVSLVCYVEGRYEEVHQTAVVVIQRAHSQLNVLVKTYFRQEEVLAHNGVAILV